MSTMSHRMNYDGEKSLDPDSKELKKSAKFLKGWLEETKFGTTAEINLKIEQMMNKAKWGWRNAPQLYSRRIEILLGVKSKAYVQEKRREMEQLKEAEKKKKIHSSYLGDHLQLNPTEHQYMKDRFKHYNKDFDFNESSDQVLLNQIIVQELLLRRLEVTRLTKSTDVEAKQEVVVKELGEQYRKNLTDLGVSRKQRVELDQSIDGNVAQLSSMVDQKIENIRKLSDLKKRNTLIDELTQKFKGVSKQELIEYCEEIQFKRKHDMFPQKNIISDTELMGAGVVKNSKA